VVAAQTSLLSCTQEEMRLTRELERVEAEIEALKHDRRRWVAIPDTASGELPTASEIEAEVDGTVEVNGRRVKLVRSWITVPEFRQWAGVSAATARRWVAGTHLPFPDGDPRNPWRLGKAPVVEVGPRRRVVLVEGIARTFRGSAHREEVLTELLTRLPSGWAAKTLEAAGELLSIDAAAGV
jgi:hypothetical protein